MPRDTKEVGERALDAAQDESAKGHQKHQTAASDRDIGASVVDEATLVPPDHSEHQSHGDGMSGAEHAHRP